MVMVSLVCVLFLVFIVGHEHKKINNYFSYYISQYAALQCTVLLAALMMHLVFLFQTFSEIHWTEGMEAGCEFAFQLIWVNV